MKNLKVWAKVKLAQAWISVISSLQAIELEVNISLNPLNWMFIFGFFSMKNAVHSGRKILIRLPCGSVSVSYIDSEFLEHQYLHEVEARIKANVLGPGETMESAGYGLLVPVGCEKYEYKPG